jgi:hypothetical protein
MPGPRGRAPTSSAYCAFGEGFLGLVGAHGARQQREGAVLELHRHAAQCVERGRDFQHVQDHRLVGTEHRARGDTEQQAVADLAGGAGDGYANGLFHVGASCRLGGKTAAGPHAEGADCSAWPHLSQHEAVTATPQFSQVSQECE